MVHIEDCLLLSLTQSGDRYLLGAEAKASDPNPDTFDCSELVEWSCARAGVLPRVPDGAYYQWQHTIRYRTTISVARGETTRGALLFVGDGSGIGRDAITHVAWSLGDGTTIEARGSRWGVGTWPSVGRFDFAGLVPGVDYSPREPLPPEADMTPEQAGKLDAVVLNVADAKARLERLEKRVGTDNTGRDLSDEMDAVIKGLRVLLVDNGHDPKSVGL